MYDHLIYVCSPFKLEYIQGLKDGRAANHCIKVHKTRPRQLHKLKLNWVRVPAGHTAWKDSVSNFWLHNFVPNISFKIRDGHEKYFKLFDFSNTFFEKNFSVKSLLWANKWCLFVCGNCLFIVYQSRMKLKNLSSIK